MVTSFGMENHLESRKHAEQIGNWVNSVYKRMRETTDFLANTDLDPNYRDNPERLAKVPRELDICDIRTIALEEDGESGPKWGLVVFNPILIPESIKPSENSYYLPEGVLDLFGENAVAVIGEEINHKKVRKEIRKISSGRGFKGEHLKRVFVMSNRNGFPEYLLCICTVRFDQAKNLFELIKETEDSGSYDQFAPWYKNICH